MKIDQLFLELEIIIRNSNPSLRDGEKAFNIMEETKKILISQQNVINDLKEQLDKSNKDKE